MDLIGHFQDARNFITVQAGDAIFREGDPGTVMYVLIDGLAEVTVADTLVELATAGALIGEMALVDMSTRSATVIARSDCRLIPVDAKQFDLLVRETPEFARHVMGVIAERLRRMNERLREAMGEISIRVETRKVPLN